MKARDDAAEAVAAICEAIRRMQPLAADPHSHTAAALRAHPDSGELVEWFSYFAEDIQYPGRTELTARLIDALDAEERASALHVVPDGAGGDR
jgi:hypothetical protein